MKHLNKIKQVWAQKSWSNTSAAIEIALKLVSQLQVIFYIFIFIFYIIYLSKIFLS